MGTTFIVDDMNWDEVNTSWEDLGTNWDSLVHKEFTTTIDESISIVDSYFRSIGKNPSELISITDPVDRIGTFERSFDESISITETPSKNPIKTFSENLSVTDGDLIQKAILKGIKELISIIEYQTDPGEYDSSFYETITITESLSKHLSKPFSENLSIKDDFLYPFVAGVVSDICFENRNLVAQDEEILMSGSSPAGFTAFRPFIDGEYDFEDAFFRFAIKDTSVGSSLDVKVTKQTITCDVEDIFFQSTATITNTSGYTRINFPSSFNMIPNVVVTGAGSAEFAVPEIISPDKGGFSVRLRKIDDSQTTGTVSWQARGY